MAEGGRAARLTARDRPLTPCAHPSAPRERLFRYNRVEVGIAPAPPAPSAVLVCSPARVSPCPRPACGGSIMEMGEGRRCLLCGRGEASTSRPSRAAVHHSREYQVPSLPAEVEPFEVGAGAQVYLDRLRALAG